MAIISFTRTTWADDTSPYITAAQLNRIEAAIEDIADGTWSSTATLDSSVKLKLDELELAEDGGTTLVGTPSSPALRLGTFSGIYHTTTAGHIGFSITGSEVLTLHPVAGLRGSAVEWQTYAPTHYNLGVGNGTQTARYFRIGDLIVAEYKLVCGSSTSIGTGCRVGLPVTANGIVTSVVEFRDDSGPTFYPGHGYQTTSTDLKLGAWNTASTYASITALSSTIPFTWATDDEIRFTAVYEAA